MTDFIRRHNRLNGILFSIVEFVFIALVMAVFIIILHLVHRFSQVEQERGLTRLHESFATE